MPDSYLRDVPTDPQFVPQEHSIREAAALLRTFAKTEAVTSRITESVEFVDAGENWEGVNCPSCGADAEDWWPAAMHMAAESGLTSLQVRAGCCGSQVALNKLPYCWPVGFGKFVLELANARIPCLPQEQLAQLDNTVGCPLLEIQAHV